MNQYMKLKLEWGISARDDYLYWQTQDKKTLKRINNLILECLRTPFEGTGTPEPLKANLTGFWSTRIDEKHRLLYTASDERLTIIQFRFHYDNH